MGYSRVVIFMVLCYGWIFYEIAEKIKIYTELRQEAQDQECSYLTPYIWLRRETGIFIVLHWKVKNEQP